MIYAIFRTPEDAQPGLNGEAWITEVRGRAVDPGIGAHGGIILDEVEVGSPTINAIQTVLVGYDERKKPITERRSTPQMRKVLGQRVGDDGHSPIYTCQAIEIDAQQLASIRGWTYAVYKSRDHVPRNDEAEAVEVPKRDLEKDELELLKIQAKAIMAADGPTIKLTRGAKALRRYVEQNGGQYGNEIGADQPVQGTGSGDSQPA